MCKTVERDACPQGPVGSVMSMVVVLAVVIIV